MEMKKSSTSDSAETRDFMNVDSFSQLPFIRPSPLKDKPPHLRLFGIDFASDTDTDAAPAPAPRDTDNGTRRFECHYCCRNFPTSQALGGHQNAHKRERQHAKRAHLHSAMAHTAAADAARIYGFFDYRIGPSAPPPSNYPSWNNNSTNSLTAGSRFYGTNHAGNSYSQQPINGSPLGLWRIPPAASSSGGRERPSPSSSRSLALLASNEELKPVQTGRATSQNRFVYEPRARAQVQEHVSLDLHL